MIHERLLIKGWLTCEYLKFETHYSINSIPIKERLQWSGSETELVCFIKIFITKGGIMEEKKIWKFLSHHFYLVGDLELNTRSCATIKNKRLSDSVWDDVKFIFRDIEFPDDLKKQTG